MPMSPRRKDTKTVRVTAYISQPTYDAMTHYIDTTYTASSSYGLTSSVIDSAVHAFCTSANIAAVNPFLIDTSLSPMEGSTDDKGEKKRES